jgi:hypothetical protein
MVNTTWGVGASIWRGTDLLPLSVAAKRYGQNALIAIQDKSATRYQSVDGVERGGRKMSLRSRRLLCVLVGVLIAAFCVLIHVRRQQMLEEEQSRPFGRFTEAQIVRRTEPLFHLLVPDRTCWMVVTTSTGNRPDGSVEHYWSVDCLQEHSPSAANLAYFQWDADTGDLVSATCSSPDEVAADDRSQIGAEQVRESSWHWLRALGLARGRSRWECDRAPRLGQNAWSLHWHSREKNVTIHLDAASGSFLAASTGMATADR